MAVPLYFRKTGEGPFLIILHGFLGSSDNWVTISKRLAQHFTVIIPDLRNHGQSPHTLTHTYEDMTDDLRSLIENENIQRASFLGHSMGGKVAMMFCAFYPEKTDSLIVADIAPNSYGSEPGLNRSGEHNKSIIRLMNELDLSKYSSRSQIEQTLAPILKEAEWRQFILKDILRDDTGRFRWKINLPVLREYAETMLIEVGGEWFDEFKPIVNYPVTFIRGLNSDYITDNDIKVIKQIYPEAKIMDVPGSGHWLHTEQPDLFIKVINESLKGK